MRKRLLLLLAVALAAIMAFGAIGTSAWFTDTDTATNTFTAGTLSVKLGGSSQNGVTITAPDNVAPLNEVGGMAPGDEFGPYQIYVVNEQNPQSTLKAKYRFTTEFLSGSAAFFDQLNARVEHGNCITGGISGAFNIYNGPLDVLEIISNDDSGPYQTGTVISPDDLIAPQNTHCFLWYFELDELADNSIQGQTVEFRIDLDATQPDNPGWSESGS
jgi:predicted ribosomally synthesized peptide with SipW-like signal peptide